MSEARPPSRALLIVAGALTQVIGTVCLVLALASLPVIHDMHRGMQSLIASIIAALAAIVCGTLAYRGRLVPLALAAGVDVGFGIVLPRGGSAIGVLLRILPADDAGTAETLVTAAAVVMFATAALCLVALPTAVKLRRWATEAMLSSPSLPAGGMPPQRTTLRGFAAAQLLPTQIISTPETQRRRRPFVIAGIAATVVALGVIIIAATTASPRRQASGVRRQEESGSGSAARSASASDLTPDARRLTPDAPVDVPQDQSIEDFITAFHEAVAHGKPDELAPLFDAKAFAFGVEGHELAEARDAVVETVRHDCGDAPPNGFELTAKFHQIGRDGDVAWIAEELKVGSKTFVVTAVAGLHDHAWTIAALQWAQSMPNDTAYKLARDGELVAPDAIPDRHDDSPLAQAMRTAFASKPSFVEARSARPDAFNFGSAPGERIVGGDAIRKTFSRIKATVHLHDAVAVGAVGTTGGWGAANVDFTDADRDGTQVTQTFRVLAAWVKEDAGWRIVQTQWSNPGTLSPSSTTSP